MVYRKHAIDSDRYSTPFRSFTRRGSASPVCARDGCPEQAGLHCASAPSTLLDWRAQHTRAVDRIKTLEDDKAALEAEIRGLKQRLFGTRSEKPKLGSERRDRESARPRRCRGRQPGQAGHRRTDLTHLPVQEEVVELRVAEAHCPCCHLPYEDFPGTEDSELVEIEVQAYRRVIRRRRYRRSCICPEVPGLLTAPAVSRLVPKGKFGVSLWVTVLLDKYQYGQPTHRSLANLRGHGLPISQGTITGGFQVIAPLLEPIYDAIRDQQLREDRWHGDETRWAVWESVPGKVGHRWYLWVFVSQSTVYSVMDPSRSAEVPKGHFGDAEGILSCDRYCADRVLAKDGRIVLAFCWAYVRRDFLDVAKAWPDHKEWGLDWVDRIGELYHINGQRLHALEQPDALAHHDQRLRTAIDKMARERDAELQERKLPSPGAKALTSLSRHWPGLTLFVDHPEVPMDNNEAERKARTPVVGRKNFYGSGSQWRAKLAAMAYSLLQTVGLWGMNERLWLSAYLPACVDNGGTPPPDVSPFLPWAMEPAQ